MLEGERVVDNRRFEDRFEEIGGDSLGLKSESEAFQNESSADPIRKTAGPGRNEDVGTSESLLVFTERVENFAYQY